MANVTRNITFKGKPLGLSGREIRATDNLPEFKLTANDLTDLSGDSYKSKILVISVVPSLDTPVCSIQTKRFNQEAAAFSEDVVILTVSMDLPFAQKRWCGAESATRVVTASDYKYRSFGEAFGVLIPDLGLLARAVFVADRHGKIVYAEYVPEIAQEPNYDAALHAIKQVL